MRRCLSKRGQPSATALGDAPDSDAIAAQFADVLGIGGGGPPVEASWAIRRFLEALSLKRPVVAVLDDIHWAEPTLLDVIEHVADWSRDAPFLLLCMARPELLEERPDWGGGKRNATSVHLEPLSEPEADALIESLLGHPALTPKNPSTGTGSRAGQSSVRGGDAPYAARRRRSRAEGRRVGRDGGLHHGPGPAGDLGLVGCPP